MKQERGLLINLKNMSNIVIISFAFNQNRLSGYYNSLTQELQKNNNILYINTYFQNTNKQDVFFEVTEEQIKNFKPDLIITFNNVISENIYKNTNCPVFILEADNYGYWSNKNIPVGYLDRIYFGASQKGRLKKYMEIFPLLKKDRFIEFKNATDVDIVKGEKVEQDIDISIIATVVGLNSNNITKFLELNVGNKDKMEKFKQILQKAKFNIDFVSEEEYKFLNNTNYNELFSLISYLNRVRTLDSLSDLDLKVFGDFHYINLLSQSLPLLIPCLQAQKVATSEENATIYNRSKVSLNLHFAHNTLDETSGYSWRVCDVLATNSALLSTYCPAIENDFGKWVKIPMFHNNYEAYHLAKKLLEEENYREDIALSSQNAIREGRFSFEDRVKDIEKIFSLKPSQELKEVQIFLQNNNIPHSIKEKHLLRKFEKNFIRPIIKKLKISSSKNKSKY